MPERKDARTPEKYFYLNISKNHQPNTPFRDARALPNIPGMFIPNNINRLAQTAFPASTRKYVKICQRRQKNVLDTSLLLSFDVTEKPLLICGHINPLTQQKIECRDFQVLVLKWFQWPYLLTFKANLNIILLKSLVYSGFYPFRICMAR